MAHRAHLFSLRFGHALREALSEGYTSQKFSKDLIAGLTVGVIAIPLAMALAIASGVAPQYGLYTAIIAGGIIAFAGGSRFSISGPTAAFVVLLYPLANKYGLSGLLVATLMSGVIMVIMAYARLGRYIEYIPESVTLGFTGGIAIVIMTLQIPDFLGLQLNGLPESYLEKIFAIREGLGSMDMASAAVALFTLMIMLLWPKLRTPVPAHLPGLILASLFALLLAKNGYAVDTIGTRFHYLLPDGTQGVGIPSYLPGFEWPWLRDEGDGKAMALSWSSISQLLPVAFAIAMLGAIEPLLCAVVLDGMSGKRHSANSELMAQGVGNILVPFLGGITATAAIARSATNYKAGAQSPVSAITHSLVVLIGLVFLAQVLAYLPMPAMSALLMVVAWNMSEAHKSFSLVRRSPWSDIAVFFSCLLLTVFFDMVIAITTGILLASLLFMKEIAGLTLLRDITDERQLDGTKVPQGWRVYKVRGPLFFCRCRPNICRAGSKNRESRWRHY